MKSVLLWLLFFAQAWGALTWSIQTISTNGVDPVVAVNSSGTAVAAWVTPPPGRRVTAAFLPLGGVWTAPTTLSAVGDALSQRAIITADGEAIVTWERGGIIEASRFSGGMWSAPVTISTMADNSVPDLATNRSGSPTIATATWERFDGVDFLVLAAAFNFSTGMWTAPASVGMSAGGFLPLPQVGMDIGGTRAIVVWSKFNGASPVKGATTPNPLTDPWGGESFVSAAGDNTGNFEGATLAMDSLEQAVAGWRDNTADSIRANVFTSGSWGAMPTTLAATAGSSPQIALSTTGGHAALVWSEGPAMMQEIQVATLTIGGSWSAPLTLSDPGTTFPDVTIDSSQNAVAIWFASSVEVADSPLGGAWSTPQTLSANPVAVTGILGPMVASNDSGYVVAVWSEDDGGMMLVKSATASFSSNGGAVNPPTNLSGEKGFNRFPTQKEFFNRLSWQASSSADVANYRIYRNSALIGEVSSTQLFFEDHQRPKNEIATYAVTAVNASGEESASISITF